MLKVEIPENLLDVRPGAVVVHEKQTRRDIQTRKFFLRVKYQQYVNFSKS